MAKGMLLLMPVLQFFDNSGNVLSGGKLYFYQPSTTTPKNTYTSSTKGVANANPVILDSAGRPDSTGTPIDIFLDGSYKLVVKTSADVTIRTIDPFNTLGQLVNTTAITNGTTAITETSRDKLLLCDASSGNVTLTLLAAATAGDGFNLKIKKTDSSTGTVTIDANASETIDGSLTLVLSSYNQTIEIYSNGTSWFTTKQTSSNPNSVDFYELPTNGTNKTTLKAADSLAGDNTVTLPTAAWTGPTAAFVGNTITTTEVTANPTVNNQPLIATTGGVRSYSPIALPASAGTVGQHIRTSSTAGTLTNTSAVHFENIVVYTTGSNTFTVPADVTRVRVRMWGGGAGAAGVVTNAGAAGGSGAYLEKYLTVIFGNNLTCVVGAGGAGGTAGNAGSDGADSTITGTAITTLTAGKGTGGSGTGAAAAGGTATNGDVNLVGGQGGVGVGSAVWSANSGGHAPMGGAGGAGNIAAAAVNGAVPGGGGGGRLDGTGGSGGAGLIIIEY